MATMDKRQRYSQSAVYGSLAYDLADPFAAYNAGTAAPEFPYDPPMEAPARPTPRTDRRAGRRAREKAYARAQAEANKQAVAPFSILGVLCAAVLIVFTMMARVQLNAVADEAVALRNQLSELEVEQNRLRIDYESAFNLTEVEEYAIRHLGMQQPRNDQIYYIDSAAPDRAEILNNDRGAVSGGWRTDDMADADAGAGIGVVMDTAPDTDIGTDAAAKTDTDVSGDDGEVIAGQAPATDGKRTPAA